MRMGAAASDDGGCSTLDPLLLLLSNRLRQTNQRAPLCALSGADGYPAQQLAPRLVRRALCDLRLALLHLAAAGGEGDE